MTVKEQEFFRAFGIEPTRKSYFCSFDYGDCPFEDCDCENCSHQVYQVTPKPITPEIVLGLEDVLIKEYPSVQYSKDIDEEIGSCIELRACQFIRTPANNKAIGKTRKEALLRLCIQLKDEIQDQVKGLFNE